MTKIKVTKDTTFLRLNTPNGASYALPIEIIKGIKSGELDSSRYYWACDFLVTEDPTCDLTLTQVQQLFEENV